MTDSLSIKSRNAHGGPFLLLGRYDTSHCIIHSVDGLPRKNVNDTLSVCPYHREIFEMASIKNVIVAGASGNAGTAIISALVESGFTVSVLTRSSSKATFPSAVTVIRTDYTIPSLVEAFKGQHAVVSTIATGSNDQQKKMVEAAITAGVKRFIPSEYGVDTSLPQIADVLPQALPKQRFIEYLKTKESIGISWTAVIVGGFFDWAFAIPGLMGWNVPEREAVIFDGGDIEYEATNVDQLGRAVAASLTDDHFEATKNNYVYVNSFTVTQNKILAILEELTGDKFAITHSTRADISKSGWETYNAAIAAGKIAEGGYFPGVLEIITGQILDKDALNGYSKRKELWNDELGLPKDDLKKTLAKIVEKVKAIQN